MSCALFGVVTHVDHGAESGKVGDEDVFALHFEKSVVLKTTKQSAHGFHRKAQVVAYVVPRHAEIEFGGGKAAPVKTF